MAATLKTYDVVCPNCDEAFTVERDPAELVKGEGDLIECPNCYNEFEWDYDPEADTLELTPYDDEDSDESDDMGLTCEDDEDDEDETGHGDDED